ncbi:MAG: molybdopterin-guanine dinucleotide biosynthesis protein B [Alphaproteobacteria bacterium]|nr:molybdopterin-guanine dinucleotide biosynthesis protein B [Alphaproteobacteria bacterium]
MRVFGLAGWSGSGKTTLLTRLLPVLIGHGLSVSTVKHAHHDFDIDQPGKDSWRHRKEGATEVMVASSQRWALMHEHRGAAEPRLDALLKHMAPVDLVLVEGFKSEDFPKLEVYRALVGKPLMFPDQKSIVALASDQRLSGCPLPQLHIDDVDGIAQFILERCRIEPLFHGATER